MTNERNAPVDTTAPAEPTQQAGSSAATEGYAAPSGQEWEWADVEGPEPYDMDDPNDAAEVVREIRKGAIVPIVNSRPRPRPRYRVGRDGHLTRV